MDGIRYITFEGNQQACNVWWNGTKRKANLNWVSNYGSANDWFAFSRYSFLSPPNTAEFSFIICFCHPPSIRPISSNFSERMIYFLLSIAFISQATYKKNLSKSSLVEALNQDEP